MLVLKKRFPFSKKINYICVKTSHMNHYRLIEQAWENRALLQEETTNGIREVIDYLTSKNYVLLNLVVKDGK
jgi:hypothetical protein